MIAPPSPPSSSLPEAQIASDHDNEWLLRQGLSQPEIDASLSPNTMPFTVISSSRAKGYLRHLVEEARPAHSLTARMQDHIDGILEKMYNPQRAWDTHDILPGAEKDPWMSCCAQWNADNYNSLLDQVQRLASLLDEAQRLLKQQRTRQQRRSKRAPRAQSRRTECPPPAQARTPSISRSPIRSGQDLSPRRSSRIAAQQYQPDPSARVAKWRPRNS